MTFEEFWAAYPVKKAKPVALRAWDKIQRDDHAAVMRGVDAGKRSSQWREGFVPHPATFLNQRRWEDEITPVKTGKTMPRTRGWDWWYDCRDRHQHACNGKRGHFLTCRDEGRPTPLLDALEAREGSG